MFKWRNKREEFNEKLKSFDSNNLQEKPPQNPQSHFETTPNNQNIELSA